MIKIENTVVPSSDIWEAVIRGARNPFESWHKSDSKWDVDEEGKKCFFVGKADCELLMRLANAGDDHGKFLRMLPVIADITAPLTVWKQIDTYKVGTVTNSESTMHCIQKKPFEASDFSFEDVDGETVTVFLAVLGELNRCRDLYNETKDRKYWNSMINLLPESYMQKRTWSANYQVLKHIYNARKGHKLGEWAEFRNWIKTLPAAELITGGED